MRPLHNGRKQTMHPNDSAAEVDYLLPAAYADALLTERAECSMPARIDWRNTEQDWFDRLAEVRVEQEAAAL